MMFTFMFVLNFIIYILVGLVKAVIFPSYSSKNVI